ncbi:MAG: hypothetical protein LBH59_10595 [Planctomycetaceae bacterium]|nr:hypothetical protein [Planctomycetaceae bacterium]
MFKDEAYRPYQLGIILISKIFIPDFMATPIRFFCQHCQLLMKASHLTSGRTVVCPQCLKKIVVPHETDSKAEQLYLQMKKNGGVNKTKNSTQQNEQPQTNLSILDDDEFEQWMDDVRAFAPENNNIHNEPATFADKDNIVNNQTTSERKHEFILRNDIYLFIVLLLVCCVSFVLGFVIRGFWSDAGNTVFLYNATEGSTANPTIQIEGKLSYKNEFGVKVPDVDATILFIPLESRTTIPIPASGFRADEGTFDPNNDNIQRIVELGGIVQRTGIDGGFKFSLKSKGKYVAIMISSHAKRTNATQLPPEVVNYLKKFFQNPIELISDFRVEKEEYNINTGIQIIHKTFE